MVDTNLLNRITARIDALKPAMIDLQKQLAAIPAIGPKNDGKGEWEKSRFLKSYLQQGGFAQIQEYDAPDPSVPNGVRPNFVLKIPGRSSAKTIWIMTHMDVVPPGERSLWENDPFTVIEKDGKLIGRGVEDNQQGLVSSLFAVKAFLDEKITPAFDTGLIFVSDEETGSELGIGYLLKNFSLFKPDDLIIVPDAGNEKGTLLEVAEKSICWLKFTTKGKQCHGSMPHKGNNSLRAASHLIVRLGELYRLFPIKDEMFDPPLSTFEPTKKEANVPNVNTIPGDDVFYLDCRILPQYKVVDVVKTIRRICDEVEQEFKVTIALSSPQGEQAAPPTPANAPVVQALKRAIKDVYKVDAVPMGIGGGTVAALFRRAGYPAAVWAKMDEMAHQPNEYCWIENIVGDAKVFAHVLLQG